MTEIKADIVFYNCVVYTVDKNNSWAESIAVSGDQIIFVGKYQNVKAFIGEDTVVLNLDGKMILPGFVDAHAHPSMAMDFIGNISLYNLDSLKSYQNSIREFINLHPNKEFYRGSGWADTLFPNLGPSKEILDEIVPNTPIALISYDWHSMWVNSIALEQANITTETPDPDGGRIERDPRTGEPTGTLRETAMKLVEKIIPDYSVKERENALLEYQKMANKAGITMCHDSMLDPSTIRTFNSLAEDELLTIRFSGSIAMEHDRNIKNQIDYIMEEREKNTHPFFQTLAAKIFIDGVIEGGTAYLSEPYAHKPTFCGEPIWKPDLLQNTCLELDKLGIQIHFHVIGDAAAKIMLDALQVAVDQNGKRDSRHMATHLQLVNQEDILRFKSLDVIGLPQPFWFKVDDYYSELALPYLGLERANKQYPMQSFLDTGVVMAGGSDFPVTIPFDPLIAIQYGITRTSIEEGYEEVLWPEEKACLEDMIRCFTYNGAYSNFLENETGSIEVGKKADFIVLDKNIFKIPIDKISKTKILLTFVGGKEVYRNSNYSGDIK